MGIASRRPPLTVAMPTTTMSHTNATSSPSTPSASSKLIPPFLSSTGRRQSSSYEMLVAATGSLLTTPVNIQRSQPSASQQSASPEARTPGTRKDWLAMRGGALHLHSTPSGHHSSKRHRRPRPADVRSVSYADAEGLRARNGGLSTVQIRPDATVLAAAAANATSSEAGRPGDSTETSSNSNSDDEGAKELPY